MKFLKKTLKALLCTSLVLSLGISAAACSTNDPGSTDDNNPNVTDPNDPNGTTVTHTVKFVTNCDMTIAEIKVKDGESFTVTDPTNGTAIFLGWYTNSNLDEQYKYTLGTPVKGDITLYAKWKTASSGNTPGTTTNYTVTFDSNGGSQIPSQSVEEGKKAFTPPNPEKAGQQFKGWLLNGSPFSFDNVITGNITLVASWAPLDAKIQAYGGYNESLYVEWTDGAPSQATVQYKLKGDTTWQDVDQELVRAKSGANSVARVDVLGITAGDYDIKIQPSGGASPIELSDIAVTAYDRSGYAHFKYTDGVGAYNDDGTLKDNALVLYVTDENKNSINYGFVNGERVDLSSYLEPGKTGIGYILNNNQYGKADRLKYGIQKLSFTYGAVAVRFLGTVSAEYPGDGYKSSINGLTIANTSEGGGSAKDNGRMARMTNAKNVTLEGVGEDAEIVGWGFHFISNDNLHEYDGSGKSFEARNMTFRRYPEDALGMEGTQGKKVDATGSITGGASDADADLISPVERCWIHNNVFYPGYFENPKESDKAEGDGSCDIKRGQYFTVSYNYYEGCHKTNLVGSSDSSQTFNYSMHHNWWFDCESRMPLLRRANMHFYNNYVQAEANSVVKSKGYALSYVTSARANSYMFSENNYFDGCNTVVEIDGGAVKAFGNVYTTIWGKNGNGNGATEVSSRTQAVSNSCKFTYRNIDYSNFDTDETLFYYNKETQQSDCLIDDAVNARIRVISNAGVNGFGKNKSINMNEKTPTSAVPVPDEGKLTVALEGSESSGVLLTGANKGVIKGKGQLITFTLATEAEVTVNGSGSGNNAPELIDSYGRPYATKFDGEIKVVLPAGTYYITSGDKDKEATISSLTFEATANSAKAKLEALDQAITAIGNVTLSSKGAIENAKTLYDNLKAEEKATFESTYPGKIATLNQAIAKLSELQVENVKTLISAIGEVNENSYPSIKAARDAYNELTTEQKSGVSNYGTLTQAESDWANVAVISINKQIANLTDVSSWTVSQGKDTITNAKTSYETVKSAYEALTTTQQGQVTNYSKVTNGLTKLNALLAEIAQAEQEAQNLADFNTKLNALTADTVTLQTGAELEAAYNKLTTAQQATIDSDKYNAIIAKYTELANQAKRFSFTSGTDGYQNPDFTYSGSLRTNSSEKITVNNTTYTTSLKMESSTSLTFTTSGTMVLKLYFLPTSGKKVTVDNKAYDIGSDGILTITLEAGNHTIEKGNGGTTNTYLFLLELAPAD